MSICSRYIIGPIQNNCYLVSIPNSKDAVIIDPPIGAKIVLKEVNDKGLKLKAIWITHAHFDHFAGASELVAGVDCPLPVGMHRKDLVLYQNNGGANYFRLSNSPAARANLVLRTRRVAIRWRI